MALLDESPRWHRILASREFEAPTVQLETTIEDAALESGGARRRLQPLGHELPAGHRCGVPEGAGHPAPWWGLRGPGLQPRRGRVAQPGVRPFPRTRAVRGRDAARGAAEGRLRRRRGEAARAALYLRRARQAEEQELFLSESSRGARLSAARRPSTGRGPPGRARFVDSRPRRLPRTGPRQGGRTRLSRRNFMASVPLGGRSLASSQAVHVAAAVDEAFVARARLRLPG